MDALAGGGVEQISLARLGCGAGQQDQPGALPLRVIVDLEGLSATALPGGTRNRPEHAAEPALRSPRPPGLLGLYQGIPLTSRSADYAGVLPDRITIYRQAICAICRTEQEVAEQVRRTVIHEVAHHFGIDDDRLAELGW